MHFLLDCEKLFIHISLFLCKPLLEDVVSLYSIQYIIHSTKKKKKNGGESILECPIYTKHDSESFRYN